MLSRKIFSLLRLIVVLFNLLACCRVVLVHVLALTADQTARLPPRFVRLLCFKVNTDYGTLRLNDCEVDWSRFGQLILSSIGD